jgi:ABC-type phosphate/phosphonate transport system substrate-binding protein
LHRHASGSRAGLPFELGGIGHSLDLRMCEPPSIAPREYTIAETGMAFIVEPGMVYIEPSMAYQIDVGGKRRRFVSRPQTAIARRQRETDMIELTASLPMYNLPEMAPQNTAFWKALSEEIAAEGFANAPAELSFSRPAVPDAIGKEVFFSQTCGYPLQTVYRGQFALLAAPTYNFPGCGAATHRAFIIVRRDSTYKTVEDLRASKFALNSRHSNSGMNLPRIMLARLGITAPFFGSVIETGSHTESIRRVAAGDLDAAAIDCVTYGFFSDYRGQEMSGLRVLGETPESPAIPFVTSVATPPEQIGALRAALLRMANDPRRKPALRGLRIETITPVDLSVYERIMAYEREAADLGYPVLA